MKDFYEIFYDFYENSFGVGECKSLLCRVMALTKGKEFFNKVT